MPFAAAIEPNVCARASWHVAAGAGRPQAGLQLLQVLGTPAGWTVNEHDSVHTEGKVHNNNKLQQTTTAVAARKDSHQLCSGAKIVHMVKSPIHRGLKAPNQQLESERESARARARERARNIYFLNSVWMNKKKKKRIVIVYLRVADQQAFPSKGKLLNDD